MQVSAGKKGERILVIAGEASGDNYGSRLIRELKRISSDREIWAVGGDLMEREGARIIARYGEISVVGLVEVFGRLSRIMGLLKEIKGFIRGGEIGCVVLIDFPDFNFLVGKYAKKHGIPVIYYIPPQLWAWREKRAKILQSFSSHIVVPFPFEVSFFQGHDVSAHYFGHPLLEILREEDLPFPQREFGHIREDSPLRIGLFPGSRESEVSRMLPLQLGAAKILRKRHAEATFSLLLADSSLQKQVETMVEPFSDFVKVVEKRNYTIFGEIDLAIASSGTVTLELAIFGVPTVIIYKVSPLTYIIGKMLVKVDRIGLPNIVSGEILFPELIQGGATPENIAGEIGGFLTGTASVKRIKEKGRELLLTLDGVGPSKRVAELVFQEMA